MPKPGKLTDDQRQAILQMIQEGVLSQSHIAKEFNISRQRVNQIANPVSAATLRLSIREQAYSRLNDLTVAEQAFPEVRLAALADTTIRHVRTWRKKRASRAPVGHAPERLAAD